MGGEGEQPVYGVQPDHHRHAAQRKSRPWKSSGRRASASSRPQVELHWTVTVKRWVSSQSAERPASSGRERGGQPGDQRVGGEVGGGLAARRHLEGQRARSEVHTGGRESGDHVQQHQQREDQHLARRAG